MHLPDAGAIRRIRRRLLTWFDRAQRTLPWRRDRDPYRIWVSEIMLQQTQVATVIPYFERFLQAFPDIATLAAADEQEVLRLWEGLGYYRRARDLHRAARQLVMEQGGVFPDDPAVVADLPGIGRYTLGAILSQAFDRRLPILEANSERVLCRVLACEEDPSSGSVRKQLWQAAEQLLPTRQTGAFNQGLMELGALVCTVSTPRCLLCPIAEDCQARQRGVQDQLPRKEKRTAPEEVREAAVVVERDQRVLLVQRPPEGRWAGMWEFPHTVLQPGEDHTAAAVRTIRDLLGIEAELGEELLTIRHGVTRFRITMVCFAAQYRSGEFRSPFYVQGRWLRRAELTDYPVSRPQRRLAQHERDP